MVYLLIHGARQVPPVPVHQVFEVQQEIGHRRAFLIAVAIVGVLGSIAKGLHELRHLDIGGACKGGNAVVAVEGIVVEGLGMGDLRPVEGLLFPLFQVAEHGGRCLGALGVVGNPGAREVQAEGQQVTGHFQNHQHQHRQPGMNPEAALEIPRPAHILFFRLLRKLYLPLAIEQRPGKGQQEAKIIDKIYMELQGHPKKLHALDRQGIIGAAQQGPSEQRRRQNVPWGEPPPEKPAPVGHIQEHKAEQEAEPVGNHIGEMEAMPDIVQLPDDKAKHKEQQQGDAANFIPQLYLLCHQKQERQLHGKNTAVEIGQALFEVGLQGTAHVARHLAHGIHKALEGILRSDVQPEALGKGVDAGLGGLQRRQGGKLQNGRHADGKQGVKGDAQKVQPRPLPAGKPADFVAEKHQCHENTHKKAHIIVDKHSQKQAHGIQKEALLP